MNNDQELLELKVSIDPAYLLEILDNLPLLKKQEVFKHLKQAIKREETIIQNKPTNKDFLKSPLGQYIEQNKSNQISTESIRKALSVIKDSLSDEVIRTRGER